MVLKISPLGSPSRPGRYFPLPTPNHPFSKWALTRPDYLAAVDEHAHLALEEGLDDGVTLGLLVHTPRSQAEVSPFLAGPPCHEGIQQKRADLPRRYFRRADTAAVLGRRQRGQHPLERQGLRRQHLLPIVSDSPYPQLAGPIACRDHAPIPAETVLDIGLNRSHGGPLGQSSGPKDDGLLHRRPAAPPVHVVERRDDAPAPCLNPRGASKYFIFFFAQLRDRDAVAPAGPLVLLRSYLRKRQREQMAVGTHLAPRRRRVRDVVRDPAKVPKPTGLGEEFLL